MPWLHVALIVQVSGVATLVLALATCFKPNWAPFTAPMYAVAKGALLGSLSLRFELMLPGLVMSTVLLTLGTAGSLLMLYRTGVLRVSERMRSVVTTALGGIFVSYLAAAVLRMVGVRLAFLAAGPVGIAIGLVSTAVAAGMLLLDFDMLERMEDAGAPRWMEWFGGFSVLVTLLWMYMELLQLMARFSAATQNQQ
jgi:uncharacterized YccA/Bax inhibitor family protein